VLRRLDEAYLVWAFEQIALRPEYKPGQPRILRQRVRSASQLFFQK